MIFQQVPARMLSVLQLRLWHTKQSCAIHDLRRYVSKATAHYDAEDGPMGLIILPFMLLQPF